ncbi:MAG TPA: hypothetical protein VFB45_04435 [Pseudolabrys sp.]|nr:hypothetical protein [Pseudolabrys sp.]
MIRLASVLVVGVLVSCAPVLAQDKDAAAPSRYTFNRVDDGFVRLDNSNGQVAHCSQRAVGWACETVPEDRKAFENEIARLTDENAALKKQVANLKDPPPPRPPATVPPQPGDELNVPGTKNVDRLMAFVGTAWHRVVDMVTTWQKDVKHKG